MKRLFLTAAIMLGKVAAASTQWYYQEEESSFGGSGTYLILTNIGDVGFGVRCQDESLRAVMNKRFPVISGFCITM